MNLMKQAKGKLNCETESEGTEENQEHVKGIAIIQVKRQDLLTNLFFQSLLPEMYVCKTENVNI